MLISQTLARARNLLAPLPETIAGLTSPYLVNIYKANALCASLTALQCPLVHHSERWVVIGRWIGFACCWLAGCRMIGFLACNLTTQSPPLDAPPDPLAVILHSCFAQIFACMWRHVGRIVKDLSNITQFHVRPVRLRCGPCLCSQIVLAHSTAVLRRLLGFRFNDDDRASDSERLACFLALLVFPVAAVPSSSD